jgi:hypothetical protein
MLIGGIFKAPGPDTYSLDERAVDRDILARPRSTA